MKHDKLLKEASHIIEPYCIPKGEKFRLKDHDPADTNGVKDKRAAQGLLEDGIARSEEYTSELQSPDHLVCRLLLEKKKKKQTTPQQQQTVRDKIHTCQKT